MSPIFAGHELAPAAGDTPPGPPPRPRLRSNDRRPDPRHWATVVPPVLAERVAGAPELEAHRALVARVDAATVKARRAEAAHAVALEADEQAERAFAAQGVKLPPPTAPAAATAAAQAQRELELLELELPASADAVLEQAHPHLDAALAELERRLDVDDERVEAAIGEALHVLDERAEVARERQWVETAMWESSLAPYGPARAVANTPVATELRQMVARLRDERETAARRRFERDVEVTMHFNPDRSPKPVSGRPLSELRHEAEQVVREREATS